MATADAPMLDPEPCVLDFSLSLVASEVGFASFALFSAFEALPKNEKDCPRTRAPTKTHAKCEPRT